ncbi:MAG: hypothetical protein JSR27_07520 [Proteobacteria bacterium]|nr:hypothetical protein [Pseudomonadota bacterium]
MPQIQPADPTQRRRVAVILAIAAIVLIALFVAFDHWLESAAQRMDTTALVQSVAHLIGACVIAMTLCLLALGRHLLLRGRRIIRDRRYPANDARPLRDTPVRESEEAVRIGNASRTAGLVACLLGVAVAVVGWFWVGSLG